VSKRTATSSNGLTVSIFQTGPEHRPEKQPVSVDKIMSVTNLPTYDEAQQAIYGIDLIPSPSPVLGKLLDSLNDPYLDAEKFEALVTKDPALSAKILRIANSAYYGLRAQISTIERAIVVIGIDEVKNICLTVLLSSMFSGNKIHPSFNVSQFWKHSLFVALASKDLAGRFQVVEPETGYILGLLHDIGRIVCATYMPHFYKKIVTLSSTKGISNFEAEQEAGLTHTQIGSWLSKKWALPYSLHAGIAYHHVPDEAKNFRMTTLLIHMADRLAYFTPTQENKEEIKTILHKLDLSSELNVELENCTEVWWENVKAIWETFN